MSADQGKEQAAPFASGIGSVVSSTRALAVLCGILFLTFLDTTIMSVTLEDLQLTMHVAVSSLQWVVNGYALTFASLMLAFGTLGDRLGRKRVMLGGIVVFFAGSVYGALAPNIHSLIAARALMGVGAAACEPGTLSIIRQVYPHPAQRARALGIWAAIAGLALAMGPVLGGILVGAGGWKAIFWFNVAAGAVAFIFAVRWVPESSDPPEARFDFAGFVLGPAALALIVFGITTGEDSGYSSGRVIALFAVGVVAAAFFALVERRSKAPMLDVAYLRNTSFSGSLAVAFATYFGVFSIFFLTALYLQVVLGYSAYRTAALFVPMAVAMIVASTYAGRWVARSGPRLPVAVGCFAAGAGVILTDLVLLTNSQFFALVLTLTLAGLGFGIAVVPITSVALSVVPARHSGMAASATTTSREVGTVVGVAALGSLFNQRLISFLTQRLFDLGVPPEFQSLVLNSVVTGEVTAGGQGAADAERLYGPIVAKVIAAAYDALHSGLTISLFVAGGVILASGVVAWSTFSARQLRTE
jgi:EmrB/QacA subfamily drug resistance transporter